MPLRPVPLAVLILHVNISAILSCLRFYITNMRFSTALTAAASLFATAKAHGGVDVYTVGTTSYQGYVPSSHQRFSAF
jgi:hypothetical protein